MEISSGARRMARVTGQRKGLELIGRLELTSRHKLH
jgi:hypothetical protein